MREFVHAWVSNASDAARGASDTRLPSSEAAGTAATTLQIAAGELTAFAQIRSLSE